MTAKAPSRGSRALLLSVIGVVLVVVIISAFVLLSRPSTSTTTSQASTSTRLVFTDISSTGSPNASIAAKVNEVFIIHLTANTGSTGYDWNVTTGPGIRYLNYTTTSVGTIPGAQDGRDYLFQAIAPGTATVTLAYGRFPPAFSVSETAVTLRVSVTITP